MKSTIRCAPFDIALSVIKTAWRYTPMRSVSLSQGEFILFFSSMIITESITRQKEVERRMNTEECKVYISHQNTSSDQQKTEDLNPSARICFELNILTKGRCQKKTYLFGNLSQTSDPTHPLRTFGTPLSER